MAEKIKGANIIDELPICRYDPKEIRIILGKRKRGEALSPAEITHLKKFIDDVLVHLDKDLQKDAKKAKKVLKKLEDGKALNDTDIARLEVFFFHVLRHIDDEIREIIDSIKRILNTRDTLKRGLTDEEIGKLREHAKSLTAALELEGLKEGVFDPEIQDAAALSADHAKSEHVVQKYEALGTKKYGEIVKDAEGLLDLAEVLLQDEIRKESGKEKLKALKKQLRIIQAKLKVVRNNERSARMRINAIWGAVRFVLFNVLPVILL